MFHITGEEAGTYEEGFWVSPGTIKTWHQPEGGQVGYEHVPLVGCWTWLVLACKIQLLHIQTFWQLETGHGRSIDTREIGKVYNEWPGNKWNPILPKHVTLKTRGSLEEYLFSVGCPQMSERVQDHSVHIPNLSISLDSWKQKKETTLPPPESSVGGMKRASSHSASLWSAARFCNGHFDEWFLHFDRFSQNMIYLWRAIISQMATSMRYLNGR